MTKLTTEQEAAIRWHLQNNVFEKLTDETQTKIIADINRIRAGELSLDDPCGNSGNSVTLWDMVKDLELVEWVEQNEKVTPPHLTFPNGFASWQETHFEVVDYLVHSLTEEQEPEFKTMADKRQAEQGRNGLFALAVELTDEFENKYTGDPWIERDWYDAIEQFLKEKEEQS